MEIKMEILDVVSLRNSTCEFDCLNKADGSALYSQGNSTVMTAIYGPGEVKVHKEVYDKASLEVTYKPKHGLPGTREKTIEGIVANVCSTLLLMTLHPRTSISIIVQEMQDDGSLLACCLNSVCLALFDSGIEMKTTAASVCCAVDSDGKITVDPTKEVEQKAEAVMTFTFNAQDQKVIVSHTSGSFTIQTYEECLSTAQKASSEITAFCRSSLEKRYSKLNL